MYVRAREDVKTEEPLSLAPVDQLPFREKQQNSLDEKVEKRRHMREVCFCIDLKPNNKKLKENRKTSKVGQLADQAFLTVTYMYL